MSKLDKIKVYQILSNLFWWLSGVAVGYLLAIITEYIKKG